jgi:hypothetical protein
MGSREFYHSLLPTTPIARQLLPFLASTTRGARKSALAPQVGKPFRQFLLGETPKTGLPHHGAGSPTLNYQLVITI